MVKDLFGVGRVGAELVKVLQKTGAGLAKPWQIRRVGKAQTDAQIDKTLRLSRARNEAKSLVANTERYGSLSDKDRALLERTITTKFNEFMREQSNREAIIARSIELSKKEKGKSRTVDEDWLLRFMKYASEASDEKIQDIWAKILVNEAAEKRPRATLKSIDSLRFFDAFFCEVFRICCTCYACFGFIYFDFIAFHLDLKDAEYRRYMRILESFGVVNLYQLSSEVDLLQRYEFLYFGKESEVGVSRLSNVDSPVYLLGPIGINLGEIIFGIEFYDEVGSSKKILDYLKKVEQLASTEVRSVCLWSFMQENLFARYGDTISVGVDGVGGYFSVHSSMDADGVVEFDIEFRDKAQIALVKKFSPEFYFLSRKLEADPTGRSMPIVGNPR